jgi:hypothetical protein
LGVGGWGFGVGAPPPNPQSPIPNPQSPIPNNKFLLYNFIINIKILLILKKIFYYKYI